MRILYIVPSIPNEFGRIRTLNLIKSFNYLGNKVDIIALYSDKEELKYLDSVRKISNNIKVIRQYKIVSYINCLLGVFFLIPLQNLYVYNIYLHLYLMFMKEKKNYDLIYIKRLRMAQYAKYFNKEKIFIDFTDSLTKYYYRVSKVTKGIYKIINIEEFYKHLYYEIMIAKKYNTVICSEDEKKYLETKNNIVLNNMKVIYNTIDINKWYIKDINKKKNKENIKLVFSGIFDYTPNVLAAKYIIKEIMPLLPENYSITFVGKNVLRELKSFTSEKIIFTGEVKDMKSELNKYDIFVCPIQAGSGVKNKILQAALVGLPIVTNNLGIEGIRKGIEKNIFLANTSKEFVSQIQKVATTNVNSKVKNLQKFIIKHYDYKLATRYLINEKNNISLSSNK